jgi:hypothetical protein
VNVVNHPGERPRPFFWPAVNDAIPTATKAYGDGVDKALTTAFR